ncbi:L-xylulokinase [Aequitasia blattaphilus]|uniref:Carbohydrate kinase n=1 Tax=Aequitasia blattaphilus TaxID=2949332 RepID=A0ABT1EB58_9FIRM|nr:FGGY-family carbohydrate kinase [Aequitasia blattaphilus]MCP1103047.1 carbohydrate kinase [Aequitasia blattaphilus]MCR8615687.1 carbohydrate kinase [Aequitasia blattaphilus]
MDKYVIGLDNGGTIIKAALFDLSGKEIMVASRQTPILTPKSGYTERDMEYLWQCNCACVKEIIDSRIIEAKDVIGIAVCGHGKGLYAWGKEDAPARMGIVSTDGRAWEYPKKWKEDGTYEEIHPQICQDLMACQQVSLLAWLKDNEREVYDNIKWVFSVKDYIRFRLTGEAYCEATDISGSGLMDVKNARFDKELLKKYGIDEVYEKLAPIKYSYEKCGSITEEAAINTGLLKGTPVAGGMFDIDASAIALSVTTPREMCTIAGTWSINEYIAKAPVMDGSIAMNSLYAIPGYYLVEECSATSAGNLEWFIKEFLDEDTTYDQINQWVSETKPEETDIYFLPFLYASNAHPLGKGSFVGMTLFHKRRHIVRAIYEGVAYSHKTHIDRLLSARDKPECIRMAGGVVNSKVWVQMFADILNMPIETVNVKELGALGCGMAASVAAEVYENYEEAAQKMVHISQRIMPNPENVKIYQKKYEKYKKVSGALDTVWSEFTV